MSRALLVGVVLLAVAVSARALPADYASVDAAAVGFVDLVRSYPDQQKEYCAWLIKAPSGRIYLGVVSEGDRNRCRMVWPKPAGTVGTVHTHPQLGPGAADPGSAGQVFSEGDYEHAESSSVRVPAFLGAPAGHVLRYDFGNSLCWGKSWIQRKFRIIRDASPSVRGKLPVDPEQKTALVDQAGKPITRPAYCVEGPSRLVQ